MMNGSVTYDVGDLTDVMDSCPKAQAMMISSGACRPGIITDEMAQRRTSPR
jgi:stage III sporulation protein SpoIIIAA